MWFHRMALEDWFDTYQYAVDYDIGESAVKCLSLGDIDIDPKAILFRYGHHRGQPKLRERIAAKMVRRDVLQDEIDSLSRGGSDYGGEDLAEMVYDLGLEQAFSEDPMAGFSEWRERNMGRIDVDDIPDESEWEEWRRMRDRARKKR